MKKPIAKKQEFLVKSPWGERQDEYYWLRDDERKNPEMLAYLNEENAYANEFFAPLKPLQQELYQELLSRIKEDDSSLPYLLRGYWYYTRVNKGENYSIEARRKHVEGLDIFKIKELNEAGDFADEEILLNINELAKGHDFYSGGISAMSFDNNLLACYEDLNGRRQYTLRVFNISEKRNLEFRLPNSNGSALFDNTGRYLFYIENDLETLLSKRIKRIDLQTQEIITVYEEKDESFYLGLDKTRDRKYIIIHASSTVSDEALYADADNPQEFTVFHPRERDLEYSIDHYAGRWIIRTNKDGAINFKIMTSTNTKDWVDYVPHDPEVMIFGLSSFKNFEVVSERSAALERLRIIPRDGESFYLELPVNESAFEMGLSANPDADSDVLRYSYSSMVTPSSVYDINIQTREKRLLKQTDVPNYDATKYRSERIWINARDGVKVPVSLVYHKDTALNGNAPLLQYGYGSYGITVDPNFNRGIIPLLDRGFVYALAHIRGGEDLGRQWYDNGKMFNKKNTFNDFIDVTKALIEQKYAHSKRIAAMGGSAGGLLMGVIANEAPELYRVIVSQVPFVDVVTTMLDTSIPLTTNEYDEWGNPETSRESYEYMLSYSPYDNLKVQAYPAMFIGTGLWDSQVQYFEPAKYVARLRTLNQGDFPIIFRINMEAGHGGKSGRYRRLEEAAEIDAFIIDQLGTCIHECNH